MTQHIVPLDQWLITHVDTSWKVKDIKHWILSKCNAWGSSNGPQPPRFRPASPVTFSTPSRRSSLDSVSWAGTEEGDDDDDIWLDEDSEDELDAEYHTKYIQNPSKRKRKWEQKWDAMIRLVR